MVLRVFCPRAPEEGFRRTLLDLVHDEVAVAFGPEPPEPARWHVLVEGRPGRELLRQSPDLKALVVPYAGVPRPTRELMREFPGVAVHNLHYNAAPTAEFAVALLLAAAKRIVPADRLLREGDWRHPEEQLPSLLLEGRTALVVGYGAVGQRVARACHGLGMRVIAVRRNAAEGNGMEDPPVHGPEMLRALLPRADAVLLCLPATAETAGLIGTDELALLPAGAVLVNVARGAIVDERALFEGLRQGRPAAAGLDVWFRYPEDRTARGNTRPAELPFEELDNVVLSPHRAAHSSESAALRGAHLAVLLNVGASGHEMHNRVDIRLGY